jgi:hypothetical protein
METSEKSIFFLVDINKSAGDLTSPTYGHRIFQHRMEPEAVDTKSSCWLMRCVTWDLDWELLVGLTYIIPYIHICNCERYSTLPHW